MSALECKFMEFLGYFNKNWNYFQQCEHTSDTNMAASLAKSCCFTTKTFSILNIWNHFCVVHSLQLLILSPSFNMAKPFHWLAVVNIFLFCMQLLNVRKKWHLSPFFAFNKALKRMKIRYQSFDPESKRFYWLKKLRIFNL